jgi:poly-gamma-glutamate synthesis protein (capsule biosynthesis protein)
MKVFGLFAVIAALAAPGRADAIVVPGPNSALPPVFHGSVSRLGADLRALMTGVSWHSGCPVALRDLRLLELDHWAYDGSVKRGRLVVHERAARKIRNVVERLFEIHFPIRRMRLIDAYGGSDDRSMAANNSSAFNCRFVAGTTRWSMHALGLAIDINPVQNPYVAGSHVSPPAGQDYVDRSRRAKGMIHAGDRVVRAFAARGWEWGGYWTYPKDYQHFSSNNS